MLDWLIKNAQLNDALFPWLFNPINKIFRPDPRVFLSLVFVIFTLFCIFMKRLTHPMLWTVVGAAFFFLFIVGLSNEDFFLIVTKADNVPIVMLIVLVYFYTWWAFRQAVLNDEYKAKAEKAALKVSNTPNNDPEEKHHTFPFLVHPEFISTIVCAVILTVWSIVLDAPLEQPSEAARTPNPSKAPWYFLGLQEMLVYFDPWMAGVVMPTYIIVGLMAIPYFDANKKGNGYFTWAERKGAIASFMFGFVILWCVLIVLGTMMRGPGWNFFGPFEHWDHNRVESLTNVNLSEYHAMIPGFTWITPSTFWPVRESSGIVLSLFYLIGIPFLAAKTIFKKLYAEMGPLRYYVGTHMVLMMMTLPIKMYLRWLINLKYLIWIPEIGINL